MHPDPPKPCRRCGQVHAWCAGHRKDGQPCGRRPRKGATVCHGCGGAAPQVRAAAERRVAEERAAQAVVTYGLPRDVDPARALLEEISRTAGHIDWLRLQIERVSGERPDTLINGVRLVKQSETPLGPSRTTEVAPGVHLWLKLYQEERRHLVDVCRVALAAGVEERRVRLAEQQGSLLATVIRGILGDLDLTPAQEALVGEVVPRHLRAVAGA